MSTSPLEPTYHHGDLKQALIEAALVLLGEAGADNLGLRELARRVGVSPAAPYRHFRSRQALLEAVATEGFRRFTASMALAREDVPAEEQLAAMAAAYVRFALVQPALFRLMFSPEIEKQGDRALHEAADAAYASLAVAAAREDPGAPAEVAISAWAMVHGLALLLLDDQILGVTPANAEGLVQALAARFVAGIRATRD